MSFRHQLRRRVRRARCHGKRRYRDDETERGLHDAAELSRKHGTPVDLYACACGFNHVGHRPGHGPISPVVTKRGVT